MAHLLDINNIAFTVLNYPMSYLEFFGVLLNLACVVLVARKKISTWPIGIVGSLLFIALFWQIALYSDAILNLYFVVTGFMGWWMWLGKGKEDRKLQCQLCKDLKPGETCEGCASARTPLTAGPEYRYSLASQAIAWALGTAIAALLWGSSMKHAHAAIPGLFTQPAAYPMWDGAILMASFAAQWLMMKKKTECWIYWIVIDVASIALYWVKDVKLTALLYVIFLGIAIHGLTDSPRPLWNIVCA